MFRTFRSGPQARRPVLPLLVLAALAAAPAAAADPSVAGRWKAVVAAGGATRDYFFELKQEGTKITGVLISPRSQGENPIERGSLEGGKLVITVPRRSGDQTRVFTVQAERKEPGRFSGTLSIDEVQAGEVTLTPVPQPAGKWNVVSKSPDGGQEYQSTLEIKLEGEALKGSTVSTLGTIALDSVALKEEKLVLQLTLPIDGNSVPFVITAAFHAPNQLVGRWKVRDAEISGDWGAVREAGPAPAAAPAAPAAAPAARLASWSGKWYGVSTSSQGRRNFQLLLEARDGGLAGEIQFTSGKAVLREPKVEGAKFHAAFDFPGGDQGVKVTLEGELQGEVLRGKWSAASGAEGEWTASKPATL